MSIYRIVKKKHKYKSGVSTCYLVHSHSLVWFETFNSVKRVT